MDIRLLSAVILTVGLSNVARSEDAEFDAKHFVNSQCVACHDSTVYTRPDRRVKSLDRLESQVRMCDANLGTKLYEDDILAVVDYLNDTYYGFEK